ncbi:hypothetical protein Tco_1391512 [Tanacetum coccineum]
MVDLCTFLVDPLIAFSTDDPTKLMDFVPLVDALLLSNHKPILQLGACVFTDRWRLDELVYGIPSDGPYQTNPPSIEDITSSIRIDREGQVRRIRHEDEIEC